ncbi:helix-turn-helix domain-containing protein [Carnobacterium jeotgali]|uniref:helix-turn-helix domain-containing protein n=1 Tax=Carnobacterium jeotgali TaxID=545534 RepID=UPI00388DF587
MSLYENVKYLAAKKGMSLPDFAEEIGLPRTALYKWRTSKPSVEMVEKVAKYFDVSIEFLIGSDHVPEWASNDDMFDLEAMLKNNVTMSYAGQELTPTEKQRVQDILTSIFWEKKEKQRQKDISNKPQEMDTHD